MLNQKGFTLIELIAVMIVLGVIAVVAAVRFIDFDNSAANRVVDLTISQINEYEKVGWANCKISNDFDACLDQLDMEELGNGDIVITCKPAKPRKKPKKKTPPGLANKCTITVQGYTPVEIRGYDHHVDEPATWWRVP
jgi:prepilin-type N-terminal cleavage/methylation domain-containing protein